MQSYQNQPPGNSSSGYQSMAQDHTTIYMGAPLPNQSLFNTKDIRSQFVSKVFSILFVQILVASVIIAWFTLHDETRHYMQQYGATYLYVAFGVAFVTLLILTCVQSTRRNFPTNFILLTVITISFALIAAITAARFQTITVLCAFGTTAFATLVLILLAKYSPFDITTCGCALCVLLLVHLISAILLTVILVPLGYAKTASIFIAAGGALLVSLYMVFDLQLIMGGRSLEISPEEYIMASLTLYIDIINLFQYMLILFGSRE